jgi:hypothetical protein
MMHPAISAAGVVMLLEGEIDPFGRLVLATDTAVGIAQVHPESLRLVQLGSGQQEQHLRIDVRFGAAASKVAQEHIPVDRIARADWFGLKRGEEFLAAAQAAVQQVGVSVTPHQEVAVALDTCLTHGASVSWCLHSLNDRRDIPVE